MQKAEEYRKHAEECRMLAGRSRAPGERDMLFNMAKTWDDLAKTRAAQIAQQRRMEDIASGPEGRIKGTAPRTPSISLNASNDE